MKTIFKTTAIVLAALATTLAPAAFAAPSDDISVTIDTRYLETDWGIEIVYDALSRKAESACTNGHTRSLAARNFERDCMSDLLDDFIINANKDSLTAHHARMTS